MPEIGDTWMPSSPFPETAREKAIRKEAEREKNRLKNLRRRKAREVAKTQSKPRVEAGKHLRHAFGGAFGRAPDNIKFMASQGTTMEIEKNPRGEEPDEGAIIQEEDLLRHTMTGE